MNVNSSMTANEWLKASEAKLSGAGITTARLDCLVLLEDGTGRDRGWLLAHPEFELQGSVLKKLSTKITQRAQHVPLAYIRGKTEFYGREFAVNAHTLIPRPETEAMIGLVCELVSSRLASKHTSLVDVGTGSGAIGITAKLELPDTQVIATDIDKRCLEAACQNAETLGAEITFLNGDLLQPLRTIRLSDYPTILLCNLPYVPDNFQINTAATHEPRHALFGGPDGLDLYRKLFAQIESNPRKPRYILAESLPPQHETLAKIAKSADYTLQKTDDFIQIFANP
jgi:release factor glutamine methyltransferase